MLRKYSGLIIALLCSFFGAAAQDSTATDEIPVKKEPLRLFSFSDPHSPKKATIYAAVLPGLGQLYNRKIWKVPVVYAAMGTATYFMLDNRSKMRVLNTQFRAAFAINKDTTINPNDLNQRDIYRRYRDFSILAMAAVYALQIVDATVDAHFYKLNIDQDLEAKLYPSPSRFLQFTFTF